jgi:hypothetical protein
MMSALAALVSSCSFGRQLRQRHGQCIGDPSHHEEPSDFTVAAAGLPQKAAAGAVAFGFREGPYADNSTEAH